MTLLQVLDLLGGPSAECDARIDRSNTVTGASFLWEQEGYNPVRTGVSVGHQHKQQSPAISIVEDALPQAVPEQHCDQKMCMGWQLDTKFTIHRCTLLPQVTREIYCHISLRRRGIIVLPRCNALRLFKNICQIVDQCRHAWMWTWLEHFRGASSLPQHS